MAGDEGWVLKNLRMWCIFLQATCAGVTLYQTVAAGVVGSLLHDAFVKAWYFVAVGVVAGAIYAVGIAGAFGFYQRILGFYGLVTLVLSGLYFVGFILLLLAVNSTSGVDKLVQNCEQYCGSHKTCTVGQCTNYVESMSPAANTVAAMGLVLAVLLAASGQLAFRLRWNAGRTGRKTARIGVSRAAGRAGAGAYHHLGVFPEEDPIDTSIADIEMTEHIRRSLG